MPPKPLLALALGLCLTQQVFRSGTELVEVDVVVLDRDGEPVRGLTADDFELYDDGRPADVATFAYIETPLEDVAAPSELGLSSTEAQRAAGIYLIVIDHLHTPPRLMTAVRKQAREFVTDHVGASDLAAVVHLGRSSAAVEFSSSKPKLIAAIDSQSGRGGNAAENVTPDLADTGGRHEDAFNLAGLDRIEASLDAERAERAFEALGLICQYVAGYTGRRKSMLLFSQGLAIAPQELTPQNESELANGLAEGAGRNVRSSGALIELARLSNMSLYTIDSGGLDASGPDGSSSAQSVERQRLRWGFLRTVADQTGGRAIVGANDLTEPFAQIRRDNGPFYLLGFRPHNGVDASKFRAIRVRVRGEGMQVFARSGYGGLAPASGSTEARAIARAWAGKTVPDLLDRPLPGGISGLPIRATANIIGRAGSKAQVLLMVEVAGGVLARDARQLDVGYRAISADGKVVSGRVDTTRLQVSERTRAAIDQNGWRYLATFDVNPGVYQLRIAARESQSEAAGLVFLDLDVPDLRTDAVVIDSVLLGASTAGATPTAAPQDALLKRWPAPPTARREFRPSDVVTAFIQLATPTAARTTLHVAITTAAGSEILTASRDVDVAPDGGPIPMTIAMKPLEPGEYVMKVSVSGTASDAAPAARIVVFRVAVSMEEE